MTAPGVTPPRREPLAIVGIGCRLPGDADSPDAFWRLLCDGVDATGDVPGSRWHAARYHDPNPGKIGKIVTRRGGFLRDIDQFDPAFFGISPREAHSLDPQQRLLLQATWEAFEDAGISADRVAGTDVGVFVGGFTLDYQLLQNQGSTSRYRFKPHSATGMMMTMLANRVSHAFDLRGPSLTVDTACSSSLVAVHLAAQSIWDGESTLALAGGVNIMIGPNTAIAESRSGFLSPQGRSRAFSDDADGYARGEGGAVVVLKPLARALADGDRIYAQILGTAVSQDGHTDGITVPREAAQTAAIDAALRRAGVAAAEVGYVEAHGTGTPVGDPIEMRALAAALTADRPADAPLLVGSVKTNIGHLEAGAGVAGLIKAALVARHGQVPASLHAAVPTRHVSWRELRLDVATTARPFPGAGRRVVGVNSFGFGGTNAHVVLAEPPAESPNAHPDAHPAVDAASDAGPVLLAISARSEEALVATAGRLAAHLRAHPEVPAADVAHTLGRRRAHLAYRHAIVADDGAAAAEALAALADGGEMTTGRVGDGTPRVAFVCSGMGPQWWGMCRGLLDAPRRIGGVFADTVARVDAELARHTGWSLLAELRRDEADSRMDRTDIAQPATFALQLGLAAQLAHVGITPDAVVGHSAGEVAAHHLAGLLPFADAVAVVAHRSRLQQRTSGQGRMLAVGQDVDALTATLRPDLAAELGGRLAVAAVNSPTATTLAGDADVLDAVARTLTAAGVWHRWLAVTVPYHSHHMEAIREDLLGALDGLVSQPATLPLYSTVTGELLDGYTAGAAYWWQNIRATVLFEPALRRMLDDGHTRFVELGPHPVLAAAIADTAGTRRVSTLATQRRGTDDAATLLGAVGRLHALGHDVDWDALCPDGRLTPLPTYPWQNRRYWQDSPESVEALFYRPVHPLLGQPVAGVHPTWEAEISATLTPLLADHRVQGSVVVPGAVYLEMAAAAAHAHYGTEAGTEAGAEAGTDLGVDRLVLHRAVILDDTCDPILRTTLHPDTGDVEFAAFTATADGELRWAVTATAELTARPPAPPVVVAPTGEQVSSLDGEEFGRRTEALGFAYGPRFRAVTAVTAGHDWATARLQVPPELVAELDAYRFHPALVDAAFQTLFGAPFLGQQAHDDPYLPTRVRHFATYGAPQPTMTVHARVRHATAAEVECDLTITDDAGATLVVIDGFAVQALSASSATSPDRIDKGLLTVEWVPAPPAEDTPTAPPPTTWLVLPDRAGVGEGTAALLGTHGHRAHVAGSDATADLAADLASLGADGVTVGVVDCRALDITSADAGRGAGAVLPLVRALVAPDAPAARMYLVTADAVPAPGAPLRHPEQAAVWGLGRVVGHQELTDRWGGLIDLGGALAPDADPAAGAAALVAHLLDGGAEDQVALRPEGVFVPRLRPCRDLTRPFPTKLRPDATYVVTGGAGALGRVVLAFLAARGARHITLLSRSALPPRRGWAALRDGEPHHGVVTAMLDAERLGAHVEAVRADVTDAASVAAWLAEHRAGGGRPVHGVVHAAGVVDDRLLGAMTDEQFAAVLAPKVVGARVLHDVLADAPLDFFVMFGSAGSVIAAPGQGNYAAANAVLDAFAHVRRAQGRPGLTIGWGPWSVGMVAELGLEHVYATRGIELITPAVGTRVLDRLLGQRVAAVVAITADWARARRTGMGGRLPAMFSELGAAGGSAAEGPGGGSLLDVLAAAPESRRRAIVADTVAGVVAAVFDCAEGDIDRDDMLDDIGMDSMMAMDFRVRINTVFSLDLPVLEILRGVSVHSLTDRVVADLHALHGEVPVPEPPAGPDASAQDPPGDVTDLTDLTEDDLRALLAELEAPGP